jgi:hypothetical protein
MKPSRLKQVKRHYDSHYRMLIDVLQWPEDPHLENHRKRAPALSLEAADLRGSSQGVTV